MSNTVGDKPAFPRSSQGPSGDYDGAEGMTLRQWYAGLAMQGLCSNVRGGEDVVDHAARAVRQADALIAALNETEPE